MDQDAHMRRIIDNLSTDLNNLSSETKRKFASVKEASEACLLKLRQINSLKVNLYKTMCESSADVIRPLILGCDTKQSKIIQICLASVQKIIEAKILNVNSASILIKTLWHLTDIGSEELKVLQTIILLVTTTDVVKHEHLAKTLTIALKLSTSKDLIVMNTATAMLSQMVTKVFERIIVENKQMIANNTANNKKIDMDHLKTLNNVPPGWMNEASQDGYMLLQDLYLLLNSESSSMWLLDIQDISKPFGLDLLKSILVRYPEIFFTNPEMCFILKERICPLLIKLFSPSTKLKMNSSLVTLSSNSNSSNSNQTNDQKNVVYFSVVSRLMRIVFVILKNYFELLVTESEIFLSLLTKFLDVDRPLWQKALAIEIFHKISVETRLIELIILNYDMKEHTVKIFSHITSGIALFIQSLFLNAATNNSSQLSNSSSSSQSSSGSQSNNSSNINQQQANAFAFQISSAQPSFIYKDITIQLLFPYISGQVKATYLDTWDKLDVPYIQDGYLLSIGFATLQELCKSVQSLVEQNFSIFQQQHINNISEQNKKTPNTPITFNQNPVISCKRLNLTDELIQSSHNLNECIHILNACSNSFLFVYNILLESSLDETITEQIIKSIKTLIVLSSLLNMNVQRDAFVTSLCKAALPANYGHNVLNLKLIADLNYFILQDHSNVQQPYYKHDSTAKTYSFDDSSERQIQVVAIGPALHLAGTAISTNSPSSSSSSSNPNTLYITAKNLLTMKSILNMANMHSEIIGSSWYIILNTMQHLTWTLGLKPSQGSIGQLKHLSGSLMTSPTSSNSSVVSNGTSGISTASSSQVQAMIEPSNGGAGSTQASSMITTAIQTEISFICNRLSNLFETTRMCSDLALHDIIDALMHLSIECNDLAYLRSDPCLFAISKLYETSVSNLNRLDLFWQKVTMHLLMACKHSNMKYREWCVDAICNMIRATFNFKYSSVTGQNLTDNQQKVSIENRESILQPLYELSSIHFNDVRQKQIECTLSILRLMGQHLDESWPLCLNIIGAIQREHTESLIRSAFQCLQLVVTDFLSMIKAEYLSLVINVVAKFGSQEQDLNISLTAIVLLWNISDYMFQNSESLDEEIKKLTLDENQKAEKANKNDLPVEMESIESVWMVLYSRLGQLCVDPRPAVRKSAGQTLFCTISSHGSVLSVDLHWKDLVWNVLFPLLEQVKQFTSTASRERDKHLNQPNFLMHHSRDTAEKQWAETSVLTLAGVTRVFNSKCWTLMKLKDDEFHKMWLFLLNIIEALALSTNTEIAQSALRGFHELLGSQNYFSSASSFAGASNSAAQTVAAAASAASVVTTNSSNGLSTINGKPIDTPQQRKKIGLSESENSQNATNLIVKTFDISQWISAWKTWLDIGNNLINSNSNGNNSEGVKPPCQTFLTCYMDLVSVIVEKLAPASKFTPKDFENFSKITDKLLSIPVLNSDYSSFILMQVDNSLTPLQNSSLNTITNFIKLLKITDASFQKNFISLIFQRLLSFVLYACYKNNSIVFNSNGKQNGGEYNRSQSYSNIKSNESVSINFVLFGEKALLIIVTLYEEFANHEAVIENSILKAILQTLYVPLSLKYSCPNSSTWKLSIECLFKILKKSLPIVYKYKGNSFESMWLDLAKIFEEFLFTKNISTSELPIEAIQKDEMIDCQLIELIRDDILVHSNKLPDQFLQKILTILNRGSIYSNSFENFLDLDSTRKLREEFSKICFETLLRFSFVNNSDKDGSLNKMALTSMLDRCKEIIQRYAHDERLNGNIPLPRPRTNEMISVLKALLTLITALKKAPKESVQTSIWNQVIALYPCLVECSSSPCPQICASIKEVLHSYFTLLNVPQ